MTYKVLHIYPTSFVLDSMNGKTQRILQKEHTYLSIDSNMPTSRFDEIVFHNVFDGCGDMDRAWKIWTAMCVIHKNNRHANTKIRFAKDIDG